MTTLIGLLGKAGSGKSTIANHLLKEHGFRVFSFSKSIKEIATDYFNVGYEEAYETKPSHVRTILQGIGSFIRECIDEDYFLSEMLKRIKYSEAAKIVIDDVRLLSEAQFINELGGIVVKVKCPGLPYLLTEAQKNHETEQIDGIPYDHLLSAEYGNVAKLTEGIEEIMNNES